MKQMYYQNRECGNLLTYPKCSKSGLNSTMAETPQTPVVGWNITLALAPSLLNKGVFCAARRRLPAARGERYLAQCTVSAIL